MEECAHSPSAGLSGGSPGLTQGGFSACEAVLENEGEREREREREKERKEMALFRLFRVPSIVWGTQ